MAKKPGASRGTRSRSHVVVAPPSPAKARGRQVAGGRRVTRSKDKGETAAVPAEKKSHKKKGKEPVTRRRPAPRGRSTRGRDWEDVDDEEESSEESEEEQSEEASESSGDEDGGGRAGGKGSGKGGSLAGGRGGSRIVAKLKAAPGKREPPRGRKGSSGRRLVEVAPEPAARREAAGTKRRRRSEDAEDAVDEPQDSGEEDGRRRKSMAKKGRPSTRAVVMEDEYAEEEVEDVRPAPKLPHAPSSRPAPFPLPLPLPPAAGRSSPTRAAATKDGSGGRKVAGGHKPVPAAAAKAASAAAAAAGGGNVGGSRTRLHRSQRDDFDDLND